MIYVSTLKIIVAYANQVVIQQNNTKSKFIYSV